MMRQVRASIEKTILMEDSSRRLTEDCESSVCRNDAQWVLYTQEALEYGFDVVKMVELELIFECLNDLHLLEDNNREGLDTE